MGIIDNVPSSIPSPPPAFGSQEMRNLFLLDDTLLATNHGSFGATPKYVFDAKIRHQKRIEASPDRFIKVDYHAALDDALLPVCRMLGLSSIENCVFTTNATTGINAVLRSLKQILRASPKHRNSTKKQLILCFSSVYGNVFNAIQYTCNNDSFEFIQLPIPYPIADEDLVERVEAAIVQHSTPESEIVLAVYDAVSSVPAVVVPYKQLTALFQRYDILTCVDAAHAIGQIEFTLSDWNPDFVVTNLHKWLFVPRGCCLFYVHPKFHSLVRPAIISEHHPEDWRKDFLWAGTTDVSSFLCTKDAIHFRQSLGGEQAIQEYTHNLAIRGGHIVASILGTSVLRRPGPNGDTLYASMVNVRVPDTETVRQGGDAMMATLLVHVLRNYHACVAPYKYDGWYWIRLSAQIYLNERDFERIGGILREVFYGHEPSN